jgi:hypothetical protein
MQGKNVIEGPILKKTNIKKVDEIVKEYEKRHIFIIVDG